ncbi:P-loop containing nucleoside triphosphate hydrolase protein [Mycena crocata]|nr:P-loop containing nucleoside triphosphate hydrolase protein [Mycena crocata]
MPPSTTTGPPKYSFAEIRARAVKHLGHQPCLWQIKVVEAILKRDGDVVCISATGSGKTLTFWLPLLFRPRGIQLVISPLNILGQQNVAQLAAMKINGITITAETATPKNFQDIEEGKYSVVVTNVEMLMQQDGGFEKLWKKPDFTSRLISLVWDEGHCASTWAAFWPEYRQVSRLRYLIPRDIPFVIVSATLPPAVLSDVMKNLQVSVDKCTIIRRSNDRPNIHLVVREMKYPMGSFKDLDFLIPENWKPGDPLPKKFLIFFDSIADSIEAAKYLRSRLPPEHRHKIKWFNSEMSSEFKDIESEALKTGKIWGLCCTDSFGMGLDLPDILLVIQWRSTCDMCTLWQRLGRAGRALNLVATGLFLVEPKRFDANIAKAEARAAQRAAASKKRKETADAGEQSPAKRAAVSAPGAPDVPVARDIVVPVVSETTVTAAEVSVSPEPHDILLPPASLPPPTLRDSAAESARAAGDQAKKTGADRIEPALDDFINAATRQPGDLADTCFRLPATIYFGNDTTTSDHLLCHPDLEGGCTRCKIAPSAICCSLCTPHEFEGFARVNLPKNKQQPKRANIADYKAGRVDFALRDDLITFRKSRTVELRGTAYYRNFGGAYIMPDEVLQRIVDCAHSHKVQTTTDLLKETRWHRVSEDGEQVLALILQHHPLPPPPVVSASPTPLRTATNIPASALQTPSTLSIRRCSKCGLLGHIGTSNFK